jgi:Fur family transcriptional regulator, ferric uptake regulator
MTANMDHSAAQRRPRTTRQRAAVASLLAEQNGFISAQMLHALLQSHGESIGLATVYRTLGLMVEAGEADALLGEDGETRYRRCSEGHHHHLVCDRCGLAVELEAVAIEAWARSAAAQHGFTQIRHTVELTGLCPDCGG